jgi:deoxyribonuclease V
MLMTEKGRFSIPTAFTKECENFRKQQQQAKEKIILNRKKSVGDIRLAAGLDIAYDDENNIACAGVVVVDFRTLETIEEHIAFFTPDIPYIPSFLFFREAPGYLKVLEKLEEKPEVYFFDGNGILHPMGIGLASHMGVEIGKSSIGIAKKLLLGNYQPPLKKGGYSYIEYQGKKIGAALQTMDPPVNPLIVSPGHLIDLYSSIIITKELVLRQKYITKIPLPIFLADKLVNERLSMQR